MSKGLTVEKERFDALLGKMLAMSPMPQAEVKAPRKKRSAKKSRG